MTEHTCGNCRFFGASRYGSNHACRRYPAMIVYSLSTSHSYNGPCRDTNVSVSAYADWPTVERDHWCGEFAPAPVPGGGSG